MEKGQCIEIICFIQTGGITLIIDRWALINVKHTSR